MFAFKHAVSPDLNFSANSKAEYDLIFTDEAIFEFPKSDGFGRPTGERETASIRDFMAQLQRILARGIVDQIDDGSRAGQYAEDYRNQEFGRLHSHTHSSPRLHSVLHHLELMIKKAGRFLSDFDAPARGKQSLLADH
jgi:hypothetical protein